MFTNGKEEGCRDPPSTVLERLTSPPSSGVPTWTPVDLSCPGVVPRQVLLGRESDRERKGKRGHLRRRSSPTPLRSPFLLPSFPENRPEVGPRSGSTLKFLLLPRLVPYFPGRERIRVGVRDTCEPPSLNGFSQVDVIHFGTHPMVL